MTQRTAVEELQRKVSDLRDEAREESANAALSRQWATEADDRASAALSLAAQYEDILGGIQ
jgi:hypothetical protein